ncbi:MAG: DNA mismatch repair endonuclease MutL [Candidatus Omnitrophica bacterium]|nr:DNA mismatch repair endonuclease MutL [Candidatus Omnitrophota bacterium]
MTRIARLPEEVVEKIAAGEVIERPASIVKELIENSLDAGASSIEVVYQNGGKREIRVTDNGCGMTAEELPLSVEHHATSKIRGAEDLLTIHSFGFRGEALTSIGAVSRLRIRSRAGGESTGTEMLCEGGRRSASAEVGMSTGTSVIVEDLFFNTPARRKFLKADSREGAEILHTVRKAALAHPKVSFRVLDGARVMEDFEAVPSDQERVHAVSKADWSLDPLALQLEVQGVQVEAFLSRPQFSRVNRTGQEFFVNRRPVTAPWLSYALSRAYGETLPHGRFPMGVVFLNLESSRLDVNVHPTKREVRISGERELQNALSEAVGRAISGKDLFPKSTFSKDPMTPPFEGGGLRPESHASEERIILHPVSVSEPELNYKGTQTASSDAPDTLVTQNLNRLGVVRVLGQMRSSYILAESSEGLMLVDQHAAHERIHYEKLLQCLKGGEPQSQRLLLPETLELPPARAQTLEQSLGLLQRIGFLVEPFGDSTFVINGVPPFLHGEVVQHLEDFLDQVEEGADRLNVEEQQKALAALVACKVRSVKAGQALAPQAMLSLLETLAACESPFTCPHGRPTLIKLSFPEIEKQFGRR